MPEMLYIHIKIHHNELISLFFLFFSHEQKAPGAYDCNTTQPMTYHVRSNINHYAVFA